ncbi:MAG: Exopolysaccharide biosynthesis protein [Chlorobi bacterium]|nr:Exopolysaccharide biosynthesis protein [Chlorobiota bacterium]
MRRTFPHFLSVALVILVALLAGPMLPSFHDGAALIAGQQKQKPKKETKPVKKDSKATKKDSKTAKKDSKTAKKESKSSRKDPKTAKKDSKSSAKTASLKEKGKKGAKLSKAELKREKKNKETASSSSRDRRGRHQETASVKRGTKRERELAARREQSKPAVASVSSSRRHGRTTVVEKPAAETARVATPAVETPVATKGTAANNGGTASTASGSRRNGETASTAKPSSGASMAARGEIPVDSIAHPRAPIQSAGGAASEPRRETRKPELRSGPIPVEQQVRADSTITTTLAEGVTHRRIATAGHQVVNVVTIDLKSGARLKSSKALDRCDGLQTACDIAISANSMMKDTAVLVATNASFWRAGTNSPIGATITDGEVVEMPGYKRWSSLMIFDDGMAEINRIELRGTFVWDGRRFPLSAVNRRGGEPGLIVYNRFYGDSIPRGSRKTDSAIVAEAMANRVSSDVGDDTETLDTAAIVRGYRSAKALEDREFPNLKIACAPLRPKRKRDIARPAMVGDTMRMVVTAIDTGTVVRPENGCVLSAGELRDAFRDMKVGDTVSLAYAITPDPEKRVREVLTGTPRLVRDGRAGPEQEIEGSKARRFVDGKLARTAIGISRTGDTIFLVTVNSPSLSLGTTGMSLEQLAVFMKSIGAYQAMNFDGGGSASMAINGAMISLQGNRPSSRRVSNALMVVRPESVKNR